MEGFFILPKPDPRLKDDDGKMYHIQNTRKNPIDHYPETFQEEVFEIRYSQNVVSSSGIQKLFNT